MTDVNNNNKRLSKKQEALLWRRNKVMQMHISGLTQFEIADTLKVSQASVSLDLAYIREQSREQLKDIIQKEIPLQFSKCRTALQFIQKETYKMYLDAKNDNMKLAALQAFSDAQREEFELVSNSNILDEALRFVSAHSKAFDNFLNAQQQKQEEGNELQRFKTMNISYLIIPLTMLGMVTCKSLSYALF